jgi:hypothetical protein
VKAVVAAAGEGEDVRQLVRALGRAVHDNTMPVWGGWSARETAAVLLGRLGGPAREAGPALVKATLEGSDAAQEAVARLKLDPKVILPPATSGLKGDLNEQTRAANLLGALGAAGRPAEADLVAALTAPAKGKSEDRLQEQKAVLAALEKIGPEQQATVDALARILADKEQDSRLQHYAFETLRKVGPIYEPLVPALAAYLAQQFYEPGSAGRLARAGGAPDPDRVALDVVTIFEKLGPRAKRAMPVLLTGFRNMGRDTQLATIKTWTNMGTEAREALPELYGFLSNTKSAKGQDVERYRPLREAAQEAIKAINK